MLRRCRGSARTRRAWPKHLGETALNIATQGSNAELLRFVFDPWHAAHGKGGGTMRAVMFVPRAVAEAREFTKRRALAMCVSRRSK